MISGSGVGWGYREGETDLLLELRLDLVQGGACGLRLRSVGLALTLQPLDLRLRHPLPASLLAHAVLLRVSQEHVQPLGFRLVLRELEARLLQLLPEVDGVASGAVVERGGGAIPGRGRSG